MTGKRAERWRGALPDAAALGALGELAGVGVFEVDEERNVVAVNAAVERISGFTAAEVVGKPCVALMRCPECLQSCGLQREGRIPEGTTLRIFRKDGVAVTVERGGLVRRDVYGGFAGGLETLRLASGRACAAAPPELDSLLGSLGRSYVVADGALRVLGLSRSLAQLVGATEEELRGQPLERIFGAELFGEGGALREAVLSGRRREGWRAVVTAPDGGEVALSLSVGPVDPADHCGQLGARAMIMVRPEEDAEPGSAEDMPVVHGIVARSPAMQKILRLMELLRETDATVLITGESGTGKELIARALHATSHRAAGPFVAVNCAAIPSELLESELFGHMRGAFTGAVRDKPGRFELADGGTVLLDEIGDLAPALQGKLLRVLQEHAFERVGDTRTRTVDVRVLAATHVNLARAVAQGRFREDLYYRLRVVPIDIPPLRERREDLPLIMRHVLRRIGQRHGRSLRLSPAATRALLSYDWPGNVRELENALEYATTVCVGQTVHLTDLPAELASPAPAAVAAGDVAAAAAGAAPPPLGPEIPGSAAPRAASPGSAATNADSAPLRAALPALRPEEAAEAARIRAALDHARWRRDAAALALGMSRTTLWRKMKEYRL